MEGIPAGKNRRWYASVLLNRLMFIYFIQQKGFLDSNQNYLRNRLGMVREHYGDDQFYAFYKQFLLPLFHEGLGSPPDHRNYEDVEVERIIGHVPYVNGGIFEPHELEKTYDIQIQDGRSSPCSISSTHGAGTLTRTQRVILRRSTLTFSGSFSSSTSISQRQVRRIRARTTPSRT